jgi:hypothetical protein
MSVNVKKHGAIVLLVDDVVLEDLVVQRPRLLDGGRHDGGLLRVQVAQVINWRQNGGLPRAQIRELDEKQRNEDEGKRSCETFK